MLEKELAESIEALTRCLDKLYDNGCLFDKLIFQMTKSTEALELLNYSVKRIADKLQE